MLNIKKLKNFSVIIVPDATSEGTRSVKLYFRKIVLYFGAYSLIVFLLGFYVLSFLPVGEILLPSSLRLGDSEAKKMEILDEKIMFLAREMESLKSANKRLRYAIMLGDSTIMDTSNVYPDTVKTKITPEGNVLYIFNLLIDRLFNRQSNSISFIEPVKGFISRAFNPEKGHYGVDYVVKENTPVYSAAGGYVVFASYTTEYGYTMIISHKNNYMTKYKHCSALLKSEGETVLQGELVALSGNSGVESTGPHLHFEIWKDGKPVNPKDFLIKL